MKRIITFLVIFVAFLYVADKYLKPTYNIFANAIVSYASFGDEPEYFFPEEMVFETVANADLINAMILSDISLDDFPQFKEKGISTCIASGYLLTCYNSANTSDVVIFNNTKAIAFIVNKLLYQ